MGQIPVGCSLSDPARASEVLLAVAGCPCRSGGSGAAAGSVSSVSASIVGAADVRLLVAPSGGANSARSRLLAGMAPDISQRAAGRRERLALPCPGGGTSTARLVKVLGARSEMSVSGSALQRIGQIAGAQRGKIARRQLEAAGVGPATVNRLVAQGQLLPRHRGVFAGGVCGVKSGRVGGSVHNAARSSTRGVLSAPPRSGAVPFRRVQRAPADWSPPC